MTAIRRQQREIELLEHLPAVIPPSLEKAFQEIEKSETMRPQIEAQP
jgi:hypothetical protein